MGNQQKKQIVGSFNEQDTKRLQDTFDDLINKQIDTQGGNVICNLALQDFFRENPYFGQKLFKFIKKNSSTGQVDYENFYRLVELLCKESQEQRLKDKYGAFDKMDIFFFILSKRIDGVIKKQSPQDIYISYSEALHFMVNVLKIFNQFSVKEERVNEQAARAAVDTVFRSEYSKIHWFTFMVILKEQLIYLNSVIRYYFTTKFMKQQVQYHIPKLDEQSLILNKELITLIYLSNTYMQSSHQLNLVFSSALHGFDFFALSRQLLRYDVPTLLLLKFDEVLDESQAELSSTKQGRSYIVGAFNSMKWVNVPAQYQGNEESYIFSLLPRFRNFFPTKNYGLDQQKNAEQRYFCYLHDSSMPGGNQNDLQGIGFGGGGQQNRFRIWIDADIRNKSYCFHDSETFRKGYLVDQNIALKLSYIEVWGIAKNIKVSQSQCSLVQEDIVSTDVQINNFGQTVEVTQTTSVLKFSKSNIKQQEQEIFENHFMNVDKSKRYPDQTDQDLQQFEKRTKALQERLSK